MEGKIVYQSGAITVWDEPEEEKVEEIIEEIIEPVQEEEPEELNSKSKLNLDPSEGLQYNTNTNNIGKALIFSHTLLAGQKERLGTDNDKRKIKKSLKDCGFDVKLCDEFSCQEIMDILDKYSQFDYSDDSCLVIVVMSRGRNGEIMARDKSYSVERLWTPFIGENCKSLNFKPKLFFIQTDQPELSKTGVILPETVLTKEPPIVYTLPNAADFLIFYSTFEGHHSWRNIVYGSQFIKMLSEVLEEASKTDEPIELLQLMTKVNNKIAAERFANLPGIADSESMPLLVSTLTKTFIMQPRKEIKETEKHEIINDIVVEQEIVIEKLDKKDILAQEV